MKIKILELNCQDLFLNLEYPLSASDLLSLSESQWQMMAKSDVSLKPLYQLFDLAKMLDEEDPDVCMLCEVGGEDSLINFNQLFLDNRYHTLYCSKPSSRNIDCAYLVKKDLSLTYQLIANNNLPVHFKYFFEENEEVRLRVSTWLGNRPLPTNKTMSRDVPELRLYHEGELVLVLFMTHLKSQTDGDKVDDRGVRRRTAEVKTVLETIKKVRTEYPNTPIIWTGDLNGNASRRHTDKEFSVIYQTTDFHDVLSSLERYQRITHVTVNPNGDVHANQYDYMLVSGQLEVEEAYVHEYKDEYGAAWALPTTLSERRNLPSDHYPVVVKIKI